MRAARLGLITRFMSIEPKFESHCPPSAEMLPKLPLKLGFFVTQLMVPPGWGANGERIALGPFTISKLSLICGKPLLRLTFMKPSETWRSLWKPRMVTRSAPTDCEPLLMPGDTY